MPRFRLKREYGDLPQRRNILSSVFFRDASVIQKTKQVAHGICQLCGCEAPFKDKQGLPYLEVHHVVWLSRGGVDKISNTVALCPNCHSKMHIVDNEEDIKKLLGVAENNYLQAINIHE